jgi:hypothetical protein
VAEASWRRACCEISSLRLVAAWVLLPLLLPFLFYFPFSYLSHGWLAVIPGMGAMALMPLLSFPLLVAKQFCIDAFWIVSSASAFFRSVIVCPGVANKSIPVDWVWCVWAAWPWDAEQRMLDHNRGGPEWKHAAVSPAPLVCFP